MTEHSTEVKLTAASVTDRGLSEKRPLNEDSFLADAERRIFAVADGVGGGEAGEIASQTAIEVLDEAFRHQANGEDIEDLMEIAIQRANNSIHKLSREHPKLATMATTLVALHLDGHHATIGHVGDSRLYRLSPDGHLHRETHDHSVVEEEVRAGRMTPEQAAHHPSRNVISRALGADEIVEVDMKTIEVEDGTIFMLCSDGITRHVPDEELATLFQQEPELESVCAELKRRCFERGAEDNLTAVMIRVGDAVAQFSLKTNDDWDAERTLISERPPSSKTSVAEVHTAKYESPVLRRPFDRTTASHTGTPETFQPARPASDGETFQHSSSDATSIRPSTATVGPLAPQKRSAGKVVGYLGLLLCVAAVAFIGGIMYQRASLNFLTSENNLTASPTPTPLEDAAASYWRRRREVDRAPATSAQRMAMEEMRGQPLSSPNPEFLYLYGRALLLSGRPQEAVQAFDKSIEMMGVDETPENAQLKIEARMASATAALMANNPEAARQAAQSLTIDIKGISGNTNQPGALSATGSPSSPAPAANASPAP